MSQFNEYTNQREQSSLVKEMMNPFTELKYQYFMRPSMWANMNKTGVKWTGLFGFRTLALGQYARTSLIGDRPSGMAQFVVKNLALRPVSWMGHGVGRGIQAAGGAAGNFLGQNNLVTQLGKGITTWAGKVPTGGIAGLTGALEDSRSVIQQVLGGSLGGFQTDLWREGAMMGHERNFFTSALNHTERNLVRNLQKGKLQKSDLRTLRNMFKNKLGTEEADIVMRNIMSPETVGRVKGIRHPGLRPGAPNIGIVGKKRSADILEGLRVARAIPEPYKPTGFGKYVPKIGRVGSSLFAAYVVASIVAPLAEAGVHAIAAPYLHGVNLMRDVANRITNTEFGGQLGPGFVTGQATTERQRALEQIHRSRLNARSAIGNEATFAHM